MPPIGAIGNWQVGHHAIPDIVSSIQNDSPSVEKTPLKPSAEVSRPPLRPPRRVSKKKTSTTVPIEEVRFLHIPPKTLCRILLSFILTQF